MKIMRIAAMQQMGLMEVLKECKFPFEVTYSIKKNMKMLNRLAVDYENARVGLLNKYAIKDERGELVVKDGKVVLDDEESFKQLLSGELNIIEEINLRMIKPSDLVDTELTIDQLDALQFMIEDEG